MVDGAIYNFDIVLKSKDIHWPKRAGIGPGCGGKAGDRCHVEVFEELQGQKKIDWDQTTCSRKPKPIDIQPPEQGEHTDYFIDQIHNN